MKKSILTLTMLMVFGLGAQISLAKSVDKTSPKDLNLTVTVDVNNVTCHGGNDGAAAAVPDGGLPPYTYLWNTGATTQIITGLIAGSYTVTVTDNAGATAVASGIVEKGYLIAVPTNANYETCEGSCDAEAAVFPEGGVQPYSYLWSDPAGQTTFTAVGLCAGTYTVTVTDGNGCTNVASVTVELSPEGIWIMTSSTPTTCYGGSDGTAYVSIMTGTEPFSIIWDDPAMQTTTTATGLSPGTYGVTVTDAVGCSAEGSVEVGQAPELLITGTSSTPADCSEENGTATVNVAGGTPGYTYLWNDPAGQTTATATGLAAGTYTVVVTDSNGCTISADVTVEQNSSSVIVQIVSITNVSCNGGSDGAAEVSVSGGTPPYVIVWDTPIGQTGEIISGISAGSYTVNVTDALGCTGSATVTIEEPAALTATLSSVGTMCGAATGSATVEVSGGTPPYTYLWDDPAGQTTAMATGLPIGDYSVVVSDANSCSALFGPVNVDDDCNPMMPCTDPLISDIVVIESRCGLATGSATIEMVGGNAGYTFEWTPNVSTTNSATGLEAGAYTVVITSATDTCSITETFTVGNADGPTPEVVSTTPATCNESNGTATLGPIGYQFEWCDGTVGNNAISLPAGPCAVTVTDPNTGCHNVITVEIEEYIPLSATAQVNNSPDCGVANGSVTILVEMGSFDYDFAWSDGGTGESRDDLAAGTYTVTVTDNGPTGCVATTTFTLTNQSVGTAEIDIENDTVSVTCIGDSDGMVNFNIDYSNDFPQPATILITNGDGVIGVNGSLEPGDYCIDVIDADGCFSTSECFTVVQPEQIDLDIAILPADCDIPGTITITDIRGGNGSYVYDWADLDGSDDPMNRTGLAAGVYALTVTDAKGCSVSVEGLTVIDLCDPCPPPVIASVVVIEATCGESDGLATITMADGNENFSFSWSPNVSALNYANNLSSGAYSVTITNLIDAQCSIIEDFTVGSIDGLNAEIQTQTDATCGAADGSATLSPDNYVYTWSNGFVGPSQSNLAEGTYLVEIVDPNDDFCSDAITVNIGSQNPIEVEVVVNQLPQCGMTNGSVTLQVSGGSGNYSYSWGGTPTQENLGAGTQMVLITDLQTGCERNTMFTLEEEVSDAFISVAPMVQTTCPGSADGFVDLLAISFAPGFIQPASVRIEDLDGNIYLNGTLEPGDYCVVIRDGNDCVAGSDCFRVENAPQIDVDIELFNQSCSSQGAISLVEVTGGNGGFEFDWADLNVVDEPQNRDSLEAAEYNVTVMDVEGCSVSQEIIILDERYELEVEVDANNISCNGFSDGAITLTPGAGVEPYNFDWNIDETEGELTDLEAGTYEFTITDANECSIAEAIDLTEPEPIEVDLGNDTIACVASLLIGIQDNPDLTYVWTDENNMEVGTTSQISVEPGDNADYVLTVMNSNQCVATDTINVSGGQVDAEFDVNLDACTNVAEISLTDQSQSDFGQITEWNWVLSNGETSELQNPSFTIDSSQNLGIELTVSTAQGCMQTISQDFNVDPVDIIVPDASACMDVEEVELNEGNTGGGYTYSWEQDGTLSDPGIPNPISTATENTTYTVTITNSDETCTVVEMVDLMFYENVDLTASGDQNVCSDMNVTLVAESDNAVSFEWSTETGVEGTESSIDVPSGPIGASETYFVIAEDENGCFAMDTVVVANRGVLFELEDTDALICEGEQFTVVPTAGLSTEGLSFEYFPPDIVSGETTIDSEPIVAPSSSTSFMVEASNDFGCSTTDSIFIEVSFIDESIEATAQPTEIIRGQESQLEVEHDGGLTFEWSNGESLDDPNSENPVATPLETTTYKVFITNEDECIEERSVTVVVTIPDCDMPYVFVPNAFTPNNDGINDIFRIRGELYITDAYLVVYSRWGEKVFESDAIGGAWDGRFKGEELCSDVYAFYYRVVCFNGEVLEGKGNVSLLR